MEKILKIQEIKIIRTKSESVKARADVSFKGFLVKGFKVFQDDTGKEYVTPPSYRAGPYWRRLFETEHEEDWQEICRRVLEKYNEWLMQESTDELLKSRKN